MASPPVTVLVSNPNENEGPTILAATLIVTIAALVTVVLRLYVRLFIIRNPGWDDGLMTFAMALTAAGQGLVIGQVHYGAGRHAGDLSEEDYITGKKLNFISQPIFLIAICIVKESVGASLLRIATVKFYKIVIISVMGFMAFYTTGCFFCTDIRVQWDSKIPSTCWGPDTLQALSYTNVTLNMMTDVLLAIVIPAPMLWSLNVNRRTRVTLLGILGLGLFACAAAAVKIGYLVNYGNLDDWLWDSRNITIWTIVEGAVGIVAGSLPALRPLFKGFLGSIYGRGTRKGPASGGGGGGGGLGTGYGRGTLRSVNSKWHTLSSGNRGGGGGSRLDDESSERGLNDAGDDGMEGYELSNQKKMLGTAGMRSVVVEAGSRDEYVGRSGPGGVSPGGINMTTTIVTFTDKAS